VIVYVCCKNKNSSCCPARSRQNAFDHDVSSIQQPVRNLQTAPFVPSYTNTSTTRTACMSQRHAAAKAARAVTGAASKAGHYAASTSSGSSSPTSSTSHVATVTWPANAKPEDIKFAKDFIKAALHGHSPIAKFQGWRNDAALQSVDPKINPLKYLNRRLIYDSRHIKTPPRKFVRQQKKLEPLKKYIRPFHTSAATTASRRAYQEEDEEADFEGPDAALAGLEDSDGPPSLALIAGKRTLHPGDWVQIRL
jgi:hypothetical protein